MLTVPKTVLYAWNEHFWGFFHSTPIRRVSEYGLAVALPHMHGEGGDLRPLPETKTIHESELRISFLNRDAPIVG